MPIVDNKVITHATIFTDDSSHNSPSYIYAKQYDKNSRYLSIKLMSANGQIVVSTLARLNATKPDGTTLYTAGTDESDGTVTFKVAASLLDQIGVVSCDITVFTSNNAETVLLTSSTFYIVVDKSNYDLDAPEATDDYVMTARASDLGTSDIEGTTILHLVDTNGDIMGHGVPFEGGGGGGVQSDWNVTDTSSLAFIKNKPTIPPAITVDSTVTSSSSNPVASSGIYSAIQTAIQEAQFDFNNYVDLGLITPQDVGGGLYMFSITSEQYEAIRVSFGARADSTVAFSIGTGMYARYFLVHKSTTTEFDGVDLLGYTGLVTDGETYDNGTVVVGFSNQTCFLYYTFLNEKFSEAVYEAENYTDTAVAGLESTDNKVTTLNALSTNDQYPSAKVVYDALNGKKNIVNIGILSNVTQSGNVLSGYFTQAARVALFSNILSVEGVEFTATLDYSSTKFQGNYARLVTFGGRTCVAISGVTVYSTNLTVSTTPRLFVAFLDVGTTSGDCSAYVYFTEPGGGSGPVDVSKKLTVVDLGTMVCSGTNPYSFDYTGTAHTDIYNAWTGTNGDVTLTVCGTALVPEGSGTVTLHLLASKAKRETINDVDSMVLVGVASSSNGQNTRDFTLRLTYTSEVEASMPGVLTFTDKADKNNGVFYVKGSGSVAGSTTSASRTSCVWHGDNTDIAELYDGLTIMYKTEIAGQSSYGTMLRLNDFDSENIIYRNASTAISTNYPVGTVMTLTFDADVNATAYTQCSKTAIGTSTTDPTTSGATVSGHDTWLKGECVLYSSKKYALVRHQNKAGNWVQTGSTTSTYVAYTCYGVWKIGDYSVTDNNTIPSAYSTTAADTPAKVASCSYFALESNSYVHVLFRYANTSASAITLNINSTGAKDIYINGTASSSTNYTLPAGTYIAYYDGTAFQFRTDGKIPGTIMNAEYAATAPWTGIQNRPTLSYVSIDSNDPEQLNIIDV